MHSTAKAKFSATAALVLATSSMATAQVVVNGDTTSGPTFDRPDGSPSLNDCSCPYQAILITISDAAAFVAETTAGTFDTYLALYQGVFDPTDPATNVVAEDDDDGGPGNLSLINVLNDGPFTTGQHTIVVTGYGESDEGTFTLTLTGALLGWGANAADKLDELKAVLAQTGRNTLRVIDGSVAAAAQKSIAARGVVVSTKGQPDWLSKNVRAWTKGSATHGNGNGRVFNDSMLQFGADVEVSPSVVVGLSFGLGKKSANSTSFTFDGEQRLIQPYIGWQSGDWNGSASIAYDMINYGTITTSTSSAGAKGDLLAIMAKVGRDFAMGTDTTLTPFGSLRIGQLKLTATSGSLAGIGVSDLVNFNELSLGALLTRQMGSSALTVGVSIDSYATDAPTGLFDGTYDQTGLSGSMNLGFTAEIGGGWGLVSGLKINGIGTSEISYSGSLQVAIQF